MGINKVQYGNTTLIDLTSDTVTADKLMQGYTAHDRTGALITGTATGGGSGGNVWQDENGYVHLDDEGSPSVGGIEYETGTWTPSEDVASYVISFSNTHTEAPFFVLLMDATGTYSDTTNSNYGIEIKDWWKILGQPIYVSETNLRYGDVCIYNRSTNATGMNGSVSQYLTYPSSESSSASSSYPRYWMTESGFRAYTNSSTRYWRAGRTYKWIAVWAPTT